MRHRVAGKKLGRSTGHRKMLRRNLITELFRHERIKTTKAKAAAIRGEAEKVITLAKRGNTAGGSAVVNARRQCANVVTDPEMVKKVFDDLAVRYEDRQGGYTRTIKLGPRLGDAAEMVLIELVEE